MTDTDTHQIIIGDTIAGMATLPERHFHTCVTSPPYWGLRDYGVDGQIGLESSPDAFVEKMVEVGRAVRRVLRDDGTFWLNLGSSYASSDTDPIRFRQQKHGQPCGTDDKELQGFHASGRACPCCGGVLLDGSAIRRDYIARTSQPCAQSVPPPAPTNRGSVTPDCEQASPPSSSRGDQRSTTRASFRRDRAACVPAAKVLASPSRLPTSLGCAPQSGHTSVCTGDIAKIARPLVSGTSGTGLFCMACGYCTKAYPTFKPKDLINMPMMVAEALQADGWWLRSVIVWAKKSPMPESVTDRPTSSWEPIFLLAKSERYFYDAEAVKEPLTTGDLNPPVGCDDGISQKPNQRQRMPPIGGLKHAGNNGNPTYSGDRPEWPTGRNQRNVWHLGHEPYKEAHFATFPTEIPRRAIKAGTSEKGCCPHCGAPWARITSKTKLTRERPNDITKRDGTEGTGNHCANTVAGVEVRTLGWQPTCECPAHQPVPCRVLEPFLGSGTTLAVAAELGRHGAGCELNPEYAELARVRIGKAKNPSTFRDTRPEESPLFGGAA